MYWHSLYMQMFVKSLYTAPKVELIGKKNCEIPKCGFLSF